MTLAATILADTQNQTNVSWKRCYLGLGSNLHNELGSPNLHITRAVESLKNNSEISHVKVSSLYQSKPMGPQDQPDFVNAVVEIDTTLLPLALLELCQHLEQMANRVRLRHWGERSLDVDILLYGNEHIEIARLTIPHKGIPERNFVLVPLAELNPNLIIATLSIKQMAMSKDWTDLSQLS